MHPRTDSLGLSSARDRNKYGGQRWQSVAKWMRSALPALLSDRGWNDTARDRLRMAQIAVDKKNRSDP